MTCCCKHRAEYGLTTVREAIAPALHGLATRSGHEVLEANHKLGAKFVAMFLPCCSICLWSAYSMSGQIQGGFYSEAVLPAIEMSLLTMVSGIFYSL